MERIKTACHSCHGGCGVIVTRDGDRLVKIEPDKDAPLNKGRMCIKGISGLELLYHPQHLNYPLRRKGERGSGSWERITWDEAYDFLCRRIREIEARYGMESITVVNGTGRHHKSHIRRFANVLGTPNFTGTGAAICLGPRSLGGMMTYGCMPVVDYYSGTYPGCIMVWGSNPATSGADGELMFHVWDALRAGTKLLVVDPMPTELTSRAALWLKLRPGTDDALALGLLHHIIENEFYDRQFVKEWTVGFQELRDRCSEYTLDRVSEITGIPEEQIVQAAELIHSSLPVSLEWGCAIEHTSNALQTVRAIAMIPGLMGSFDVPGGFCEGMNTTPEADQLKQSLPPEMAAKRIGANYRVLAGDVGGPTFGHPMEIMEAAITGKPYPIKCAFFHGANALMSWPNSGRVYEAISKMELVVVMDQFMTPTAELADIVLPAASWLEIDNVYSAPSLSDHAVMCQKKLTRVGERKSDEEFFLELCQRLGKDYKARTVEDILNEQLRIFGERHPAYAGIDLEQLKKVSYISIEPEFLKYKRRGRFNTPSGKMELWSSVMERVGGDPLPCYKEGPETPLSRPDLAAEYDLILTTGRRQKAFFISEGRQVPMLRRTAPYPRVSIHPDTAAVRGIEEGDWVYIETARGRITQKAHLLPDMRRDVVSCELGWWYPEADLPDHGWRESNCNILTKSDPPYDPLYGAYDLRGLLCRIAKNPDGWKIETRYEQFDKETWRSADVQNGGAGGQRE